MSPNSGVVKSLLKCDPWAASGANISVPSGCAGTLLGAAFLALDSQRKAAPVPVVAEFGSFCHSPTTASE